MVRIIPFKSKSEADDATSLENRLKANPDDLEALRNLFVLLIRGGRFHSRSDFAISLLYGIERMNEEEVNDFLISLGPLMQEIKWKESLFDRAFKSSRESRPIEDLIEQENELYAKMDDAGITRETIRELIKSAEDLSFDEHMKLYAIRWKELEDFRNLKTKIANDIFHEDDFLIRVRDIFPMKATYPPESFLGKTSKTDPDLKDFMIQLTECVLSIHGLVSGLAYLTVFTDYPDVMKYSKAEIKKLLSRYALKYSVGDSIYRNLMRVVEKYLTIKFKKYDLNFDNIFKLFSLRYCLGMKYSDTCRTLLNRIKKTEAVDILNAIHETDISEPLQGAICWNDFFVEAMKGYHKVFYIPGHSKEKSDFIKDMFVKLHDEDKYDEEIVMLSSSLFDYDENLPKFSLNYAIYITDDVFCGNPSLWVEGYFRAGIRLFENSFYQESLICLKNALFHASFMYDENPLDAVNIDFFKDVARKVNAFESIINFLAKFKLLNDKGFPLKQSFLNEIEITINEVQFERNLRSYQKIDNFYEIVAKEDFPALMRFIPKSDEGGKFELTAHQLRLLIERINSKSEIIHELRSMGAKCDLLLSINLETYNKQAAIIEILNNNSSEMHHLIEKNSEFIIESIHQKNQDMLSDVNESASLSLYEASLGRTLWEKLDEDTRKFLLHGQSLYEHHKYSRSTEFGFIAVEYCKALENEYEKKIISRYLQDHDTIDYGGYDNLKTITRQRKITLGEFCVILDKARKVKNKSDSLWFFKDFIKNNTIGKDRIFDYKGKLYEIKDKYRNPAAHPSKYPLDLLESFRSLLFEDKFLREFIEAIQPCD